MQAYQMGVVLLEGLENWQIVQQQDGCADIALRGSYTAKRLSADPPLAFADVNAQNVAVKARVVREDTAEDVLPWQCCEAAQGAWRTVLRVPAGGLYRLELTMTHDGQDGYSVTRGDMVHHWGVGDVFVIAGQSNAAGRAKESFPDAPELGVHLLRNNGRWDLASHPMNDCTNALYGGHYENHNPGNGPFLAFGKRLKSALGYPVGLIMAAYGGSPLRWWNPDENGALLDEMVDMLQAHSPRVKGMLWYQGEADGFEESGETYLARFTRFVAAARERLNTPDLPVFTLQLARCTYAPSAALDRHWGLVREAQRRAAETIAGVYVLPTLDLALYDAAHLSAASYVNVGERVARCALAVLYGKALHWRAPQAQSALAQTDGGLLLAFSSGVQWLNLHEMPAENLPFSLEDEAGLMKRPVSYCIEDGGAMRLSFARPAKAGMRLHGAWEMNPPAFIPCDAAARLPFLAFYGMEVR